jgi:uncharacterized protein (TIGR03435 family)
MFAQTGRHASLSFEVSTVKPAKPDARSSNLNLGENGVQSTNLPVLFLLQFAFDLNGGSKDQLVGMPAWVSSVPFDINAKMDEDTTIKIRNMKSDERVAAIRQMVQVLLADRFHLIVHHETRVLSVLALVVAAGGPKLLSASDTPTPPNEWTGLHNPKPGRTEGRDAPVAMLVNALSSKPEIGGRLVLDQTGLLAKYNFTLTWAPVNRRPSDESTIDESGPSLFTALKEQLGLQLQSRKAPVDCIVIDHIEQPSPN